MPIARQVPGMVALTCALLAIPSPNSVHPVLAAERPVALLDLAVVAEDGVNNG